MPIGLTDAQDRAYGFLVNQLASQEKEVIRIAYQNVRYPQLVPVDSSADDYAAAVEWYSRDAFGEAERVAPNSNRIATLQLTGDQHSVLVETYKLSHEYDIEDINRAMMGNRNLSSEGQQELMDILMRTLDKLVMDGDSDIGWDSFWKHTSVSNEDAATKNGSKKWADKTADEIIADVQEIMGHVYEATSGIYAPDTLAIPYSAFAVAAAKRTDGTDGNVLEYIRRNNIYTQSPQGRGRPLNIVAVNELENAGDNSNDGRMIAYRRDPKVLKLHLPMPPRLVGIHFNPATEHFCQVGKFRTGGLEVRLPSAMAYRDGITA